MEQISKHSRLLFPLILILVTFSFIIVPWFGSIRKAFALESYDAGVYWNIDCTRAVTEIDWGQLTPGAKSERTLYIRNEVNEPRFLILLTKEWTPAKASNYIILFWDYTNKQLNPNEVLTIIISLRVSENIREITDFNFFIVISGELKPFPWDVTCDGYVGLEDIISIVGSFGLYPESPDWNPKCDINNDRFIGIDDLELVLEHYGESV